MTRTSYAALLLLAGALPCTAEDGATNPNVGRVSYPILGCSSFTDFEDLGPPLKRGDAAGAAAVLDGLLSSGACRYVEPGPATFEVATNSRYSCVRPAGAPACIFIPESFFRFSSASGPSASKQVADLETRAQRSFVPVGNGDLASVRTLSRTDTEGATATAVPSQRDAIATCFSRRANGTSLGITSCVIDTAKAFAAKSYAFSADCLAKTMRTDSGDPNAYALAAMAPRPDGTYAMLWRVKDKRGLIPDSQAGLSEKLSQQFLLLCPAAH